MTLDNARIKKWSDFANAFLRQYKYKNIPLQSHVHNIKCLRPIFSMDLHNILSLVNQKHIVRHYTIWVDTFRWSNIEL